MALHVLDEANRCLGCKKPLCQQGCPIHTNIPEVIRLLKANQMDAAGQMLFENNPLTTVCSLVCNHENQCEGHCVRNRMPSHDPVHFSIIEDYISTTYANKMTAGPAPKNGMKAAVVGSGPAGLTCAGDLARKGYDVTVFEALHLAGGVLVYGIPAFRLPDAVTDRAVAQVTALGVRIESGKRLGADLSLDALEQEYDAVLLALGLGRSLSPRIPGADLPAVHGALEVLHKARKGERFDAASAIVIGGGSTAMDVALSLKKMGLDVTMLVMEGPYDMPIPEGERDEALEEGVRIENRWGVTAIRAGQDGLTCTMQRCLAVFDHNGAFAPELDPLCTAERSADMVVLAIGQGLDPVDGLPQTARHLLDADPQTGRLAGRDKVFAAGDCTTGASSVVAAMASGRSVARCVSRFLCEEYPLALDEMAEKGWCNDFEPHLERSNGVPRGSLTRLPVAERSLTAVTEQVLTPEEAQKEAARCMACGRAFEANRTCWFCLPCEIDCPEEALTVRMPYLVR